MKRLQQEVKYKLELEYMEIDPLEELTNPYKITYDLVDRDRSTIINMNFYRQMK